VEAGVRGRVKGGFFGECSLAYLDTHQNELFPPPCGTELPLEHRPDVVRQHAEPPFFKHLGDVLVQNQLRDGLAEGLRVLLRNHDRDVENLARIVQKGRAGDDRVAAVNERRELVLNVADQEHALVNFRAL
jgi:hypothetical protein